jgi:hypothetical protein
MGGILVMRFLGTQGGVGPGLNGSNVRYNKNASPKELRII